MESREYLASGRPSRDLADAVTSFCEQKAPRARLASSPEVRLEAPDLFQRHKRFICSDSCFFKTQSFRDANMLLRTIFGTVPR